jgi:GntR family transcriptional regulator
MREGTDYLYLKLAENLMAQIKSGALTEGSPLPSERELCEQYGVSRTTVRQALQELQEEGYANSIQGKGTFVSRSPVQQELRPIYNFDEGMRRLGKTPETYVADFVKMEASGALAESLALPEGAMVYRVMLLCLADGDPMLLETNFLPIARFPGITQKDLERQSLYHLLSTKYSLSVTRAEETFEPVLLRPMESQIFSAWPNALGILIECVSYEGDAVVKLSKSVSPSYKFKHHMA